MKKPLIKHYPLLTVDGMDVGMNVHLRKGTKYWSFQCYPDPRLDEPFSERIFRYLCENDGIMHSLNRAFYDFPTPGPSRQRMIWICAVWLSGKSLTWEHMEHILESALPHWRKAGKAIESWLAGQTWRPGAFYDMVNELYDEKQNYQCWEQYQEWAHEQCLRRKNQK
jgi:hypothetical protein